MLCCSVIAILLGQCGALGAAMRMRLFGGSGALASLLAPIVAGWSMTRWIVVGGVMAGEFTLAVAAWPALYALDMPQRLLAAWPLCSAVSALTR